VRAPGTNVKRSDRYSRGWAKLLEMQGPPGEQALAAIESASAEMARYVVEYGFGDVHSRPTLNARTREISIVSALAALGTAAPQLRAHIQAALHVGCTRAEIIELMILTSVYAGFPAALNGLSAANEVFVQLDAVVPHKSPHAAPPRKSVAQPSAGAFLNSQRASAKRKTPEKSPKRSGRVAPIRSRP
jgi:4-carboxymuconolactone decarboxylase